MLQPSLSPITPAEQALTDRLCTRLGLALDGATSTMFYITPHDGLPGAVLDGRQTFRPFARERDAKAVLMLWCTQAGRYASYETTYGTTTSRIGNSPKTMAFARSGRDLATTLCQTVLHDKTP